LTDASALIVLADNPRSNYPYSLGLFAVGVSTGIGALVFGAKAQRQIEHSIADYNRSLPERTVGGTTRPCSSSTEASCWPHERVVFPRRFRTSRFTGPHRLH